MVALAAGVGSHHPLPSERRPAGVSMGHVTANLSHMMSRQWVCWAHMGLIRIEHSSPAPIAVAVV